MTMTCIYSSVLALMHFCRENITNIHVLYENLLEDISIFIFRQIRRDIFFTPRLIKSIKAEIVCLFIPLLFIYCRPHTIIL